MSKNRGRDIATYGAYYATLVAFLVASFFPEQRVWGFNWWAYYPDWVRWGLFGIGAAIPLLVHFHRNRLQAIWDREYSESHRPMNPAATVVAVALVLPVLFYLLRSTTFFLGDGYTCLSLLAHEVPLVKYRDLGEALAHIGLKQLLGLKGESGALITFQIISIAAGVLFFMINVWAACKLYVRGLHRAMFVLFMLSIGPMLLFFGYVENYSLFVCSVALFAMGGLLVAMGKLGRTYLIPLTILPCFFHIFGVCLIPSALYAAVSGSSFGDRLAATSWKTRSMLVFLLGAAASVLFFWLYWTDYFFRFAIIPLVPDRFTVDGYWLLAPSHFADFVNLLLLLVPSLLLMIVVIRSLSLRRLLRQREYRFLGLLVISTLTAAFIFDPKLGMARDWDLFSFAGIPLAFTAAYMILDKSNEVHNRLGILLMAIALGLLALFPRVIGQAVPGIAISRFGDHTALDRTKNMYSCTNLMKYYQNLGDTAALEREAQRYRQDYPERYVNREGVALKDRGNCPEAIQRFKRALQMNPVFSAAYSNLGMCYQSQGKLELAIDLFRISSGLNPYNAIIATKLGGAYFEQGDYEQAEKSLRWAVKIDADNADPLLGLSMVYERQGRTKERDLILEQLVQLSDPPVAALHEMAERHFSRGDYEQAAQLFKRALGPEPDSSQVLQLIEWYPQLERFFE